MKISKSTLSVALAVAGVGPLAVVSAESPGSNGLPPHHPPVQQQALLHPTLAKFRPQLRCPYAQEWLSKGAHKAAIDLGLTTPEKVAEATKQHGQASRGSEHRRRLEASAMGSCNYNNAWSGPTCMEFRGTGWDETLMNERCGVEQDSSFATGGDGCPRPQDLAGWCLKETTVSLSDASTIEATSMMISGMADCAGNKMACETFVGGTFEAADACAEGSKTPGGGGIMGSSGFDLADLGEAVTVTGDGKCLLAPGAIGAAHQAGYSNGYSPACPGTPGEGSPYMWPMAWATDFDTQSMAFGNDEVIWRSQGRTFYRLDKNWKRSDTTYSKGVLRTVGQGPCADINEDESANAVIACNKDFDFSKGDPLTTMIHRGSKMYFIEWKNSTDVKVGETDPSLIETCNYMDLMVVGNIRPDWFLDNRGDDTDVQYLGDQHVYYADGNVPRLVKQWRKKDFASQYFTMSVTGNPRSNPKRRMLVQEDAATSETDGVHWPLILNIPGEGFGDDMLQVYTNHELLDDDDDDLFLLIENLEESGGSCPLIGGRDSGSVGPPQLEVHVPSNLEVDANSWFTNVYTFSPVWQAPMKAVPSDESGEGASAMAVTEEGRVKVESCYDPSSQSVKLSVEWQGIQPVPTDSGSKLPWVSLGYRADERCAMTPMGGGNTEIVFVGQAPSEESPKAYIGSLVPEAQRLDQTAISSVYESFWPLAEATGYSGVELASPLADIDLDSDIKMERSAPSSFPDDSITLSFSKKVDGKPEVMHLMYAIGMSHRLGIHTSRGCFDVVEFPTCPAGSSSASASVSSASAVETDAEESSSSSTMSTSASFFGIAVGVLSYWFL